MNTIVITNVSDELWLAITERLRPPVPESSGRTGPATGTAAPVSTTPIVAPQSPVLPPVAASRQGDRALPPGAWKRSEVKLLQDNLRMDGGVAQAAAIDLAASSPDRRVRREQILALPGRSGTSLRGFSKPLNRVEMAMIGRGQLEPRRRAALLMPELVAGTAIAYRLGADIVDDAGPE